MCVLYKHSRDLLSTKPGNNSFNGLSLDRSQRNALVGATPHVQTAQQTLHLPAHMSEQMKVFLLNNAI